MSILRSNDKYDPSLRSSDNSNANVPGSIPARPQSGKSQSTIPDDSRRSQCQTFATKSSAKCATWIKGSINSDPAFYPRFWSSCHGARTSTIYVPPTTLMLMSQDRYLPCLIQASPGRQFPTIPDAPNAKPSLPRARPNVQHG